MKTISLVVFFFVSMKYFFLIIALFLGIYIHAQDIVEEDFVCTSDTIQLKGTLSYPSKGKHFPTIIIVSGTGQQDRDGTFGPHKPFKQMADYLSKSGYAVLRVDDRGTGESGGLYDIATTMDFVNDVTAELNQLKIHQKVNAKKIGLMGHSEGGAVAFIQASQNKDVKFIISLAGLAIDGYQSLILQNRALLQSDKYVKSELVEDYMGLFIPLFSAVKETKDTIDIEPVLQQVFEDWKTKQTAEKLKAMGMDDGRDQNFLYRYIRIASSDWYRQMIKYNPDQYLSNITLPVLALNGDKDIMVTADENLSSIERNLIKAGNKNYRILKMEGLNHMFQHCVECDNYELTKLPEAIAPEVLEEIQEWLEEVVM